MHFNRAQLLHKNHKLTPLWPCKLSLYIQFIGQIINKLIPFTLCVFVLVAHSNLWMWLKHLSKGIITSFISLAGRHHITSLCCVVIMKSKLISYMTNSGPLFFSIEKWLSEEANDLLPLYLDVFPWHLYFNNLNIVMP